MRHPLSNDMRSTSRKPVDTISARFIKAGCWFVASGYNAGVYFQCTVVMEDQDLQSQVELFCLLCRKSDILVAITTVTRCISAVCNTATSRCHKGAHFHLKDWKSASYERWVAQWIWSSTFSVSGPIKWHLKREHAYLWNGLFPLTGSASLFSTCRCRDERSSWFNAVLKRPNREGVHYCWHCLELILVNANVLFTFTPTCTSCLRTC